MWNTSIFSTKYFLLSLIILLVGVVFLWPLLDGDDASKFDFMIFPKVIIGGVKIEGASLEGLDHENRKFIITFTTLERSKSQKNQTTLGKVNAILEIKKGEDLVIEGQSGISNEVDKTVTLDGGVTVQYKDHTFTADKAKIDTETNNILTSGDIEGVGGDLSFSGKNMSITNKGLHITLQGKSNLIIH